MLISKVCDDNGEGRAGQSADRDETEYQTASELFDLMSKNVHFSDNDSLSAQDLILLYENIDIGTRLMNDASELTVKKPNQHVETVVYNDHDDLGSDTDSEIYNNADIHDVYAINQERLNFFDENSLENLCRKFGELAMHTSDIPFDYDKKFVFQNTHIKSELRNLNAPGEFNNLCCASLLDYICCKRLEDNYNFHMDNVIKYVQNTIEQLKRISNGDYLTDRAKQKWREVNSFNIEQEKDTKILATSTSIPLHVECKKTRYVTFNDIAHSELDFRSLSKILEKKIIVEIPKLICGSYQLFSKRCADKLIISCQQKLKVEKEEDSRVDVVLKLEKSQTGQLMSNISSIMVLKMTPAVPDLRVKEILPPSSINKETEELTNSDTMESAVTVIEFVNKLGSSSVEYGVGDTIVEEILEDKAEQNEGSCDETNDYPYSDLFPSYGSVQYSSESSLAIKDTFEKPVFPLNQDEKTYNVISPFELQITMRKLKMRDSTLEEVEDSFSHCTSKRRSPVRVRIKSPYENKSFALEEKKRRRLLEIREKREKKKLALSENCKISKHKYAKGVLAQASSSVTKLSITNKSFYNSIYGHNNNITETKTKHHMPLKVSPDVASSTGGTQDKCTVSPILTDRNSKKYVNRSYYLDDADTEVMYIQMMKNENKDTQNHHSTTNSIVSNEFNENMEILKQLISPSDVNFTTDFTFTDDKSGTERKSLSPIEENKYNMEPATQIISRKLASGDECRKRIDALYGLINQFGKGPDSGNKQNLNADAHSVAGGCLVIHGSESGTSVNHLDVKHKKPTKARSSKPSSPTVTKGLISSKKSPKHDTEKAKTDRNNRVVSPVSENPLKAISQLLRDFEKIKKNKAKSETKPQKKLEVGVNDVKNYSRQGVYRKNSRFEQHLKDEQEKKPDNSTSPRDKKLKPTNPAELVRTPSQLNSVDDKNADKFPKKKISDIIDEAKEARGEAVRGPSKFPSRLYSLAQPKKSYVQAHHEEYQNRYGRNVILAERLQKLATTSLPTTAPERNAISPTNRNKGSRNGPQISSVGAVKQRAPSVPLLDHQKTEVTKRKRRSASSSPESPSRLSPTRHKHKLTPPDKLETSAHRSRVTFSRGDERSTGLRCRVPVVPQGIDTASLPFNDDEDVATKLGDTLHRMVNSVVLSKSSGLTALPEDIEGVHSEALRSESDYCVNILEDNHLMTAVSEIRTDSLTEYIHPNYNSKTELEDIETNILSGSFQKRLRIKNLPMTPKHSMQQIFLLQSGDASSVLVKSVNNIKLNRCSAKSLHDLKAMPVFSNSHLDWKFAQIPMQISRVGYAFPQNKTHDASATEDESRLHSATENRQVQNVRSSQCFRGASRMPLIDSSAQVDLITELTTEVITVSVENFEALNENPDKPVEMEQLMKINCETDIGTIMTTHQLQHKDNSDNNMVAKEPDIAKEEVIPISTGPPVTPREKSSDDMGYTTSLDMLVGLLTEIQKITDQNQITASDQNYTDLGSFTKNPGTIVQVKNKKHDLISIKSLDDLRRLESSVSLLSYYVSNFDTMSVNSIEPVLELRTKNSKFEESSVELLPCNKEVVLKRDVKLKFCKPVGVDKEVTANMCESCIDTCTNVPSNIIPIPMCSDFDNNSFALGVTIKRSTQSMLTISEYQPILSKAHYNRPAIAKIVELPKTETSEKRELKARNDTYSECSTKSISLFRNDKKRSLITQRKYYVKDIVQDPMIKFKRDILVSVYSILVLTVFAALSFPELLSYQT